MQNLPIVMFSLIGFVAFLLFYVGLKRKWNIEGKFSSLFSTKEIENLKFSILQEFGEIFPYSEITENISCFIYSIGDGEAFGNYYYFGIRLKKWSPIQELESGLYGNNYAVERVTDKYLNYKGKPAKFSLSKLVIRPNIPSSYSFVEVTNNEVIAFYEMPKYFGYGCLLSMAAEISSYSTST